MLTVDYSKLWKILIERHMIKKDLREASGVTTNVMAKLGKNQHVSTKSLCRICTALDCTLADIMDLVEEEGQ